MLLLMFLLDLAKCLLSGYILATIVVLLILILEAIAAMVGGRQFLIIIELHRFVTHGIRFAFSL